MSQGRLSTLLLLLISPVLLSACGKNGPTKWDSLPVAIYSDPSIANNPEKQADLQSAMSFWESKAGKRLFDYKGAWTGSNPYSGSPENPSSIAANVIFFLHPWAFAPNIAGQTIVRSNKKSIEGSIVMINPNTDSCAGDCTSAAGTNLGLTSERKVFAHELGHFLGLSHVQDEKNIMYPTSLPGASLDAVIIDEKTFHDLVSD